MLQPHTMPLRLSSSLPLQRRLALAALTGFALAACASRSAPVSTPGAEGAADLATHDTGRAANLTTALPMPNEASYTTHYMNWTDTQRQRNVPAKLYLPARPAGSPKAPLIVFSHGLGGSMEGYSYLGKFWASQGYASLHLQHVGSDRSIWAGNPLGLAGRMQAAAHDSEAIARVADLRFALDRILTSEFAAGLDAQRIVAAGHSYGGNTTLLVSGAQVTRKADGTAQRLNLRDPRIQAAIVISAPPFYGSGDLHPILAPVTLPILQITATEDEINVPGYHSLPKDRIAVFEATGSRHKTLAVFKDGSHSIFTDRLNTGGIVLNPKVKIATRELTLAFLQQVFEGKTAPMAQWAVAQAPLLARFERGE
jgi:alpha-beta hydrolase superfamily lysophospholipase